MKRYVRLLYRDFPRVTRHNSRLFIRSLGNYLPDHRPQWNGNGIVTCGGGVTYIPSMFVGISMIRHLKVDWPVQIWHFGEAEVIGNARSVFRHLKVEWVDAVSRLKEFPPRIPMTGWTLKTPAILASGFEKVLFLDADSFLTRDFRDLFCSSHLRTHGAALFADVRNSLDERSWKALTGLDDLSSLFPSKRPDASFLEVESGQMMIEQHRFFEPLWYQMLINNYHDFYFSHFFGDKHTLQIAMARAHSKVPLLDTGRPVEHEGITYDWLDGRRLFEHRTTSEYRMRSLPFASKFSRIGLHREFLMELNQNWRY